METKIKLGDIVTTVSREIEHSGPCKLVKWFVDGERVGASEAKTVASELFAAGAVEVK